MNKEKLLSFSKDTLYYLTALFPFALSFGVCFNSVTLTFEILFACALILFMPKTESPKIMPIYLSFIIFGYITYAYELGTAVTASIICGILLIASSRFYEKAKLLISSPAVSGVMLSTALTATVLFTTDYFGIGATGDTVREMISSYISLGFHPNWRGVLYGTVVMVIMITFPRKFKKFSKTVSASFIAIVVALILNLFLNPSFMPSAINELPAVKPSDIIVSLTPGVKILSLISCFSSFKSVLIAVASGIALFIVSFYALVSNGASDKKDYVVSGIANGISGCLFYTPLPYGINKSGYLPRIAAVIIVVALSVFGGDLLQRIPLHACAVVVIVGAWENVKWGEIKKTFSGILPIAAFTVSVISCLTLDLVYGVIISAAVSVITAAINSCSKLRSAS